MEEEQEQEMGIAYIGTPDGKMFKLDVEPGHFSFPITEEEHPFPKKFEATIEIKLCKRAKARIIWALNGCKTKKEYRRFKKTKTGNKKFEYKSWKLQDIMEGEILYIHAGMKVLEKKVNVSDELYRWALEKVEKENLFGCIVGCVVFGHPEKTTNGYAWPVKSFFKFDEPIRNVKGNLGIWKFKVCKKTDK